MRRGAGIVLVALVAVVLVVPAAVRRGGDVDAHEVQEKTLVDNERVLVMELVFPPGFKGDEHEAPVDEFAYVIDGEFAVVTRGKGKTVVRRGQVEWAPKGVVHYSVNETKRPARVLVVLLKER
jgi:quercetin dioxygenase-like cupin family protein